MSLYVARAVHNLPRIKSRLLSGLRSSEYRNIAVEVDVDNNYIHKTKLL